MVFVFMKCEESTDRLWIGTDFIHFKIDTALRWISFSDVTVLKEGEGIRALVRSWYATGFSEEHYAPLRWHCSSEGTSVTLINIEDYIGLWKYILCWSKIYHLYSNYIENYDEKLIFNGEVFIWLEEEILIGECSRSLDHVLNICAPDLLH